MDKEKIITYQQDIIDRNEAELKRLREENDFLNRSMNDLKGSIADMKQMHETTMTEYKQGLDEIKKMRMELSQHINEAILLKQDYSNKMQDLIKRIRKSNKDIKLYCSLCGEKIVGDTFLVQGGSTICENCMAEQE